MSPEYVQDALKNMHGIDVGPALAEQFSESLAALVTDTAPPPFEISLWNWQSLTSELEAME